MDSALAALVLESLKRSVIIVSPVGEVIDANPSAERWIDRSNGVRLLSPLRSIVEHHIAARRRQTESWYRMQDLRIRVSSLSRRRLLIEVEAGQLRTDTPLALRERYGLTVRQTEVAMAAALCLTPREIALRLGIRRHTVRTHLKAIHRKLCVNDRAGLVLAVLDPGRGG